MPSDMSRMVMCVPDKDCIYTTPSNIKKRCCWLPRGEAEVNETYRQVIPYCAVRNENGHFLTYERAGNESRLHGFSSIGIGGHIDNGESLEEGIHRELLEEIGLTVESGRTPKYLGLIIENSSVVDKVHIGLMYLVTTVDTLAFGEELLNPEWKSIEDIKVPDLESWSRILLGEICHPF
jgi:predicted NUDIX family phosphoesterase